MILSTSSIDIGVNNLLEPLVVEVPLKGDDTLVLYYEGLGNKGGETKQLVLYEEKEVHAII